MLLLVLVYNVFYFGFECQKNLFKEQKKKDFISKVKWKTNCYYHLNYYFLVSIIMTKWTLALEHGGQAILV